MQPTFDKAPLILTLALADDDHARFDALRRAHFPPERNLLPAHVTLFHHLAPEQFAAVSVQLAAVAAETPPFPVQVAGLRSLGRGTAFALESDTLTALRGNLARTWWSHLVAQDRQGFRAHVTVQNKVTPQAARELLAMLSAGFAPFAVAATGLSLWRYRGGPWEAAAAAFPFTAPPLHPPGPRHRCV